MAFVVLAINTACWAIFFWWMHRISVQHKNMLAELQEGTRRIQRLTRAKYEGICEVPGFEEINGSPERVAKDNHSRIGGDHR
jgi:heme exporter protein D